MVATPIKIAGAVIVDRATNGEAWHGDPVWSILKDITAEHAAKRAVANIRTIWELVAHTSLWESEVSRDGLSTATCTA
jgi:hypothetical protein